MAVQDIVDVDHLGHPATSRMDSQCSTQLTILSSRWLGGLRRARRRASLNERDEISARAATARRARRVASIAGIVLVLGVLYGALTQAATAADTPLGQAFGRRTARIVL